MLTGKLVILRPLAPDDFDALYAVAADPRIWEQHPIADRHEEARFREFFQDALTSGGAFIVLDRSTQTVIGSSRYHGYDPVRREVEIGWTFLARSHWGGRYNGEMKRLMLAHAFRWVERVVFLIGPQNIRSQRAVERIGGRRVGIRFDGGGRESLVYEITASRDSSRIEIVQAIPRDLDTIMELVKACITRMQADAIDQWDGWMRFETILAR
ncbi:MAG TPA: GNAT family N-acetyltransferase [Gemmatimonadaceae bacterium]|nr:GNAT family N-acetyltransferase [Gemmatimonadaceae bacterium]